MIRRKLNLLASRKLFINRNLHNLNVVKLNRCLLNLKGPDTYQFLQGLVTNDLRYFLNDFDSQRRQSIFTLLLQTNGRTFADLILYNVGKITDHKPANARATDLEGDQDHSIVIECDLNVKSNLLRLLKLYKLRKNLELNELADRSIWCVYSGLESDLDYQIEDYKDDDLMINKDPRLTRLGFRCLTKISDFNELKDRLNQLNLFKANDFALGEVKSADYVSHRFRLGVGEGLLDHPSGQCLPLEDNVDLLNGVSFNKGCYLGQELIARTHYTGVVRKRLMPVEIIKFNNQILKSSNDSELNHDLKEKVKFGIQLTREDNRKKRLGKMRSISSNLGLGVFYHQELDAANYFASNQELGLLVKINKPIWWPDQLT